MSPSSHDAPKMSCAWWSVPHSGAASLGFGQFPPCSQLLGSIAPHIPLEKLAWGWWCFPSSRQRDAGYHLLEGCSRSYPSGGSQGPTLLGDPCLQEDTGDLPASGGHCHFHRAQGSPGRELPSINSLSPGVLHPTGSSASCAAATQAPQGQGGSPGSSQGLRGGTR